MLSSPELRPPVLLKPAHSQAVRDQAIVVNPDWWSAALTRAGLGSEPLTVTQDEQGRSVLRRRDVWVRAAQINQNPLDLLWHTLAWGAGSRLRMCRYRIEVVADDPRAAAALLRGAAAASREDPAVAYHLLYRGGRSALRGLGPAFGTKYLYFAGGGDASHPCLILDSRVASALRTGCGWKGLRDWGWCAETYAEYCSLLENWRVEHGLESAAQWELALFGATGT